jgi:hypothetical protein
MPLANLGAAAGFLVKMGMTDPDTVTTGELTLQLTAAGSKPSGAYLVMPNSIVESGGIKIELFTGTGQTKVVHFLGYSPKAT